MKRLAVVVALVVSAAAARAEDGAALFAAKCKMCHGADGKGSPVGLKMGAKDLTATKASVDQIEKVIENGQGKMTAFKGKLSDAEIDAVAKYVKSGLK
jgi:cytochrome c6